MLQYCGLILDQMQLSLGEDQVTHKHIASTTLILLVILTLSFFSSASCVHGTSFLKNSLIILLTLILQSTESKMCSCHFTINMYQEDKNMVNEILASSMNLFGIEATLVITFWIKFQKMRLLLVLKTQISLS